MDDEFSPAIELQQDNFQQSSSLIKPEPELTCGAVVIQIRHIDGVARSGDSARRVNPVLECGGVNLH